MKVYDAEFVKGFMRMATDGNRLGWHERNGGNLTYRMKDEDVKEVQKFFEPKEWKAIGTSVPKLANSYFLVTGSGKFFSNVERDPESNICIIEIDDKGDNYRIVWGLKNGGIPTSELPTHLMNHEVKMIATNGKNRVIYHSHPANLIALTFVLPLTTEVFTRELWEAMTECSFIFPQGIGVLPWMVPGGKEIAVASSELMKTQDAVIWAHHGLFASGEDFDTAFGLMHAIEKASEILIKVYSVRPDKLQTITPENLREFAKIYKFDINEKYLYKK